MSVTTQWLYNALQQERLKVIVVDCRDYIDFERKHIGLAVCMPPELGLNEEGNEDFVDLTELHEGYFKHTRHFEQYESRTSKHLVVYNDNDHNMWIGHVISCMDVEGLVLSVQALEEGFSTFQERYPFLCTTDPDPQALLGLTGYPFPVEVDYRRLYLSRGAALNPDHIGMLHINQVFTIDTIPEGVERLLEAKSLPNQPLDASDCTGFLSLMADMGKKESTVILYSSEDEILLRFFTLYVMSRDQTPLREAYNLCAQSYWRDDIQLSSSSLRLLTEWEQQNLGSTSVTESELRSGQVPLSAPPSCLLS